MWFIIIISGFLSGFGLNLVHELPGPWIGHGHVISWTACSHSCLLWFMNFQWKLGWLVHGPFMNFLQWQIVHSFLKWRVVLPVREVYIILYLPLKRQSRLQQTTYINIFSLFFRENKTWCFKWILCWAEDSHEKSSLIFIKKIKVKN